MQYTCNVFYQNSTLRFCKKNKSSTMYFWFYVKGFVLIFLKLYGLIGKRTVPSANYFTFSDPSRKNHVADLGDLLHFHFLPYNRTSSGRVSFLENNPVYFRNITQTVYFSSKHSCGLKSPHLYFYLGITTYMVNPFMSPPLV